MSVFRNASHNNFFTTQRTWAQDKRLSSSARGTLALMLSMPLDWSFTQSWMIQNYPEGEAAVRNALKELFKYGYLCRDPQARNPDGRWAQSSYAIYDHPQISEPFQDEIVENIFSKNPDWSKIQKISPILDFPVPVDPVPVNQGQQVKHSYKKDIEEKKETYKERPTAAKSSPPKALVLSESASALRKSFSSSLDRHVQKGLPMKNTRQELEATEKLAKEQPLDLLEKVIAFAHTNSFWKGHVLSIHYLKEKFITLKLRMENASRAGEAKSAKPRVQDLIEKDELATPEQRKAAGGQKITSTMYAYLQKNGKNLEGYIVDDNA